MKLRVNKNYNYAFVFYDIQEKRVAKVFKICKKYLQHYQFSVFRGEITPSNIRKLFNELQEVIDEEYDHVCFILTMNDKVFDEVYLGKESADDLFI